MHGGQSFRIRHKFGLCGVCPGNSIVGFGGFRGYHPEMSNRLFRFGIPPAPISRLITNVWFDPMQPVLVIISCVALLLSCGSNLRLRADEKSPVESSATATNGPVDYVKDVRPILRAKCAMCHNEAEPSGGLRLDAVAQVMKGGDSGPVLVARRSAGAPSRAPCPAPPCAKIWPC